MKTYEEAIELVAAYNGDKVLNRDLSGEINVRLCQLAEGGKALSLVFGIEISKVDDDLIAAAARIVPRLKQTFRVLDK